MKKIRVKLKEKATPEMIAGCGKPKAFASIAGINGSRFEVTVVHFEGKDYFVVSVDGKVHECMPL